MPEETSETISVKLQQWFGRRNRYVVADSAGVAWNFGCEYQRQAVVKELRDQPGLGLLLNVPARQGHFGRTVRRPWVAVIWWGMGRYEPRRHTTPDPEQWIIEVFGKTHLADMERLAEELAAVFRVNVRVGLREAEPRQEFYYHRPMD